MPTRGTDPRSAARWAAGFSLMELIVTMFIFVVIGQAVVAFFANSSKLRSLAEIRIETHQALLATMDSLTRDIRLAGACLPEAGSFIALAGTEAGTRDQITIRTGITSDQGCLSEVIAADAPQSSNTLTISAGADGLAPKLKVGDAGYVTKDGATGDFFRITGISGAVITSDTPWTNDWTVADKASFYPLVEHVYAVCAAGSCPDGDPGPALTLTRNRGSASTFASGLTALDVRYRKIDGTFLALPAGDADWRLVREVLVQATAQSVAALPNGGAPLVEDGTITVKPRNLQP